MMTVKVQNLEDRLREVDMGIMETSLKGCELIQNHAPVADIDVQTEFLRHLYSRRNTILNEMRKAGLTEHEAYAHIRQIEKEVK